MTSGCAMTVVMSPPQKCFCSTTSATDDFTEAGNATR
jgi:hypothetical protein